MLSVSLTAVCLCHLLSRKHQQCFCLGLHQRLPDGERPAGQRKPALLSRIHSQGQGERPNERQLRSGRAESGEQIETPSQEDQEDQELLICWCSKSMQRLDMIQSQRTHQLASHPGPLCALWCDSLPWIYNMTTINVPLNNHSNRWFYILTGNVICLCKLQISMAATQYLYSSRHVKGAVLGIV